MKGGKGAETEWLGFMSSGTAVVILIGYRRALRTSAARVELR